MNLNEEKLLDQFDATIIGAGGAGLSLILAMKSTGYLTNHKVLIIEPPKNITNNRTWCFWAKKNDLVVKKLGHFLKCSWNFIEVQGQKNHFTHIITIICGVLIFTTLYMKVFQKKRILHGNILKWNL